MLLLHIIISDASSSISHVQKGISISMLFLPGVAVSYHSFSQSIAFIGQQVLLQIYIYLSSYLIIQIYITLNLENQTHEPPFNCLKRCQYYVIQEVMASPRNNIYLLFKFFPQKLALVTPESFYLHAQVHQ